MMAEAVAPRPGPDDTNLPDQQVKVHRSETKTRTPVEAKREGPTLDADKSDVHRSRVRNPKSTSFDIHDRVNYAVTASEIKVSRKEKLITLELAVDTEVSPIMEYFEIFLPRMMLSRRAAEFLHCNFALVINNTRLL